METPSYIKQIKTTHVLWKYYGLRFATSCILRSSISFLCMLWVDIANKSVVGEDVDVVISNLFCRVNSHFCRHYEVISYLHARA